MKAIKNSADFQRSNQGVDALTGALAEPFEPSEVRFKPAVVSGNRAMALAYVDARVVQDRLDDVLGVDGWQDDYECLPDGSVVCRLRLRLGQEWITKVDVGGPSEQPDGGDRMKAAFRDALKRAAVKFGVGRYLYRLPSQWLDYDLKRRQFQETPALPAWAMPNGKKETRKLHSPQPTPRQPSMPQSPPAPRRPAARAALHTMPANGAELQRRLYDYDARLAGQGICKPGELVKHIVQAGLKAGYDSDLATWSGPALALAVYETKCFEAKAHPEVRERKEVA
jgi:hypothetical protein